MDQAYQKLPGLSVQVDESKCVACETCLEKCFVSAITLQNDVAFVGDACARCGLCVSHCASTSQWIQALFGRGFLDAMV